MSAGRPTRLAISAAYLLRVVSPRTMGYLSDLSQCVVGGVEDKVAARGDGRTVTWTLAIMVWTIGASLSLVDREMFKRKARHASEQLDAPPPPLMCSPCKGWDTPDRSIAGEHS